MDICIEGSTTRWNIIPGSQRYIQRVAADIEVVDKKVSDQLRKYLSYWVLVALPQTKVYKKVYKTMEEQVEGLETTLEHIETAKK